MAGGAKTPEQEARDAIDQQLLQTGWLIQNRDEINLSAGRGIAIREFKMADGYGFADYILYLDKQAIGALEAKPAGYISAASSRRSTNTQKACLPIFPRPYAPYHFCMSAAG